MIEVNRSGEVWVFAEQEQGKLCDVPLELLSKGRQLADTLGVALGAALLGDNGLAGQAEKLIAHGADKVYLVEDKRLGHYQTASYSRVLCDLVARHKPQVVLYGATPLGRDLAPTVASRMWCGLTADCTDLQIGDHTDANKQVHKNLMYQIRPAFGGNIIATIVNYDRWPQMATVREGVMVMSQAQPGRKGQVLVCKANLDGMELPLEILETHRRPKRVNLKAARIIVAGGAGIGGKDNFRLLWDLANVLGAAVAGSRAAVDLGYIDHDHQVGQTGTTVRPALYIACGISGAVQHRAGMQESAKILAINTDRDAPIFSIAHYGIVGNYADVLPRMVKAIRTGAGVVKAAEAAGA